MTLAAVMAMSCNTKTKSAETTVPATDTAGLTQFQQWKAQNELGTTQQQTNAAATPQTRTVVKYYPVKSATRSSSSGTMRVIWLGTSPRPFTTPKGSFSK